MAGLTKAQDLVLVRRPRFSILGTFVLVGGLAGLSGIAGCSLTGSNDSRELPPDIQDPAVIKTPDGALGYYRSVVANAAPILDSLVVDVGVMTDELMGVPVPVNVAGPYTALDSRNIASDDPTQAYRRLHKLRAQAREARGFVTTYLSDSTALAAHLYALEGYAIVLLADLYCSGVPLSTVDFGADYTLAAGSTTEELYQHAVALFDSALTRTSDSAHAPVQQLAAVGRGRALLALGQYTDAAAAVASVPTTFRYDIVVVPAASTSLLVSFSFARDGSGYFVGNPSMGDREGVNGLDYRSSGDPRTPVTVLDPTPDGFGNTVYFPAKYSAEGPTTYVLADGVEARLIEAEAALSGSPDDGQWLAKLNQLRATVGLSDTTDPGTAEARVNLLFRERAFWLYLTAHRQGDLRRLVRQYHRERAAVYPAGFYAGGNGQYGDDVTLPVPAEEQRFNPNYTGCLNRNA